MMVRHVVFRDRSFDEHYHRYYTVFEDNVIGDFDYLYGPGNIFMRKVPVGTVRQWCADNEIAIVVCDVSDDDFYLYPITDAQSFLIRMRWG